MGHNNNLEGLKESEKLMGKVVEIEQVLTEMDRLAYALSVTEL